MTGNPDAIEAVLEKVNTLMRDIETVRFDPFDPSQRQNWTSKMTRFQQEVKLIEDEANQFINDSFQSLRSAEGAFEMMQNFKHIRSRDAINATMMRQLNEILSTFVKEVDNINDLFEVHLHVYVHQHNTLVYKVLTGSSSTCISYMYVPLSQL